MSRIKKLVAEEAISVIKDVIKGHFGREMGSIHHVDGGVFVSAMGDGKMMSAYWHPTKMHSATCLHDVGAVWNRDGKIVQKATSEPGYWAIAYAGTPLFGAQNKYNYW